MFPDVSDLGSLARRAPRAAPILITVFVLGGVLFWGIGKATAAIDFPLLVAALRATPLSKLAVALSATGASYLALFGYDLAALRYARARAPLKAILVASFSGFAIGNAVGLGAFSGGAVRYRIYTAAGVAPERIARVILFLSLSFALGLLLLADLGFLLHAAEIGPLLGVPPLFLRGVAAVLLVPIGGFLVICALRRRPWRHGPFEIAPPGAPLVLGQLCLITLDILAAATTLWVLFPSAGLSFAAFTGIYAAALGLGVLSHVPGGVGVFELAMLCAVGGTAPRSEIAAALLLYRVIYFFLPLLAATILLASIELRLTLDTAAGRWVSRGAGQLAPLFLAATTFAVGATLVTSGAIPAFTDRLQILQLAVPLWAVEISHFLTSVAGVVLLFAARGLMLRLDGAWWLAFAMALLCVPLSLVKGLAVVAPSVAILLLLGLVAARHQFRRRASLLAQPLSLSWLVAIGSIVAATVWILFFAFRDVDYARELWWQFEFDATAPRALRAVLGVAVLGLGIGMLQLLRPAPARSALPTADELDKAQRIALRQARPDALLALMQDKSLLFSESGRSFLMFATRGRTWATLGDPIGPRAEWQELIWRFIETAQHHGARAAFYQVPAPSLPYYLDAGLAILKLGEEARVLLPGFSLAGPTRADLRYALKRGERDGLRFEMIRVERVPTIFEEIATISKAWLAKYAPRGEKRFSVAAFEPAYVLAQPVALLRQNGKAVAFATLMTTDLRDEVTVGLMRYRPDEVSRYAMEYLFVRLILWSQEQGYAAFSLGMVPLSGLHTHRLAPSWHRIGRLIWSLGRRFYNFQGLRTFKGKFDPDWEPRYLAASGWFGPYLALLDIAGIIGGGSRSARARRHPLLRWRRRAAAALLPLAFVVVPGTSSRAIETGNLGAIHEADPAEPMRGLVVFFSGTEGWSAAADRVAATLAREGALVVGVDLPAFLQRLDAYPGNDCHDVVGDIESVSRQLQRERSTSVYETPIVAGIGEGGTLAGIILAQAPAATIAGALAYDPGATLHTRVPLCSSPPARPDPAGGFAYGPWQSVPGFWSVAFRNDGDTSGRRSINALKRARTPIEIEAPAGAQGAGDTLAMLLRPHLAPAKPSSGTGIADLPLIELRASSHGPLMAIILSGDGGWRDLDKTIAEKLRSEGVSVVGWDSLRYFWSAKTPEQTARDLNAVIDSYETRWGARKVALIGYSFGADVLPFAYDDLSPEAKADVVQLSLLGFAKAADFEISVAGWLGAPPGLDALPTEPPLAGVDPSLIQCFYGEDEDDTLCPRLKEKGGVEVIQTSGGHHFDGDYDALARRILDGFRRRAG
jgi:phosphatidylglycerol lysyltransferase